MSEELIEVLAAIGNLSDRMFALEERSISTERKVDELASRFSVLERKLDGVDRIAKAVARKLLAPAELVSLGIQDARPSYLGSAPSNEAAMPMAAKGHGE